MNRLPERLNGEDIVRSATGRSKAANWSALADSYGARLTQQLQAAATVARGGDGPTRGTWTFFNWLYSKAKSDRRDYDLLFRALSRDALCCCAEVDELVSAPRRFQILFVDVLNRWRDEYLTQKELKPSTKSNRIYGLGVLLEIASTYPESPFPYFERRWLRGFRRYTTDPTRSLADLGWPEAGGMPHAAQERASLSLLRSCFIQEFEKHERLFQYGQRLLSQTFEEHSAGQLVQQELQRLRRNLQKHGALKVGDRRPFMGEDALRMKSLTFWTEAGAPTDIIIEGKLSAHQIFLGCLGPTPTAAISAIGVLATHTGWNPQPLSDLPANPFVFCGTGGQTIATSEFIASFKTRAHREVLAYVGQRELVPGYRLTIAENDWRETVNSQDPTNQQDGYANLQADATGVNSALDILDRYSIMSQHIRGCCKADRFWVVIKSLGHVAPINGRIRSITELFPSHPILGREGVAWSAIRKSVLILRRSEAGTISAVRASAGHAGTGVLMPHYMNTPPVIAELDQNIRDFQDGLQSVITEKLTQEVVSPTLNLSLEDIQRAARIAAEAGIQAIFRISQNQIELPEIRTRIIDFHVTDERLKELYLIHRSLVLARNECLNRARWVVHWLPVLIIVKAVGRELFRSGLGGKYITAARMARRDLRCGAISLPLLGD